MLPNGEEINKTSLNSTAGAILGYIGQLNAEKSSSWAHLNREQIDLCGLVTDSLTKLQKLESKYCNPHEVPCDELHNYLIGNPTRLLIEWFQFYLYGLGDSPGIMSTDKIVSLCAETCVLDFIERHIDDIAHTDLTLEETKDKFKNSSTCSRYIYISPENDQEFIRKAIKVYTAYNEEYKVFTDFFSNYPSLFTIPENGVRNINRVAPQDEQLINYSQGNSSPMTSDDESTSLRNNLLAESFEFSFFLFLNHSDLQDLYDERILEYWGDRFWVQDATICRTLVITPNGLEKLTDDDRMLVSNASHEFFHFYLNNFFGIDLDLMYSSQHLLPKWFLEGLCNVMFMTQRGRKDDGFREVQVNKLLTGQEAPKNSLEIITSDKADYLHYSVFVHYLLSAISSILKGEEGISPIPLDDHNERNGVLKKLRDQLSNLELRYTSSGLGFHNQIVIDIVNGVFVDTGSKINILDLFKTFDENNLLIYAEYFFPEFKTDQDQLLGVKTFLSKMKELAKLKEINSVGDNLINIADLNPKSQWNAMTNQTYERHGGTIEGSEMKVAIKDAITNLVELSIRYGSSQSELMDEKYYLFGNSARTLYEWFTFYLSRSTQEISGITPAMWINLIAETDVLLFLEKKWREGLIQDSKYPFAFYTYTSSNVKDDSITSVYNDKHTELCNTMKSHPLLYKSLSENYFSNRNEGLQDNSAPLKRNEDQFIESMIYSFFVVLDDDDFNKVFSDIVLRFKSPRFWVLECPSVRSVIITPNGIRGLGDNMQMLVSNAKHEAMHSYFDNRVDTSLHLMRSAQYLFPKWFNEGVCNYLTGRGRVEDGFRKRQLDEIKKAGFKSFDQIVNNEDELYEYFTLVAYFIMSVINSAARGFDKIELIGKSEHDVLESLVLLRHVTFDNPVRDAGEFRNSFIEDIVMRVLALSEPWKDLTYEQLKHLFDQHWETIFNAYYHESKSPIIL